MKLNAYIHCYVLLLLFFSIAKEKALLTIFLSFSSISGFLYFQKYFSLLEKKINSANASTLVILFMSE